MNTHRIVGLGLLSLTLHARAAEDSSTSANRDLTDLSIEELMSEPVTSVSKRETKLAESAAAIAVLTQEDIQQSGLQSIPELLRLVPGVAVSQTSAHSWAVGVRGFADELSNKLQVLIDGRTVYTTAVGGVHWDMQDVLLEDVERIEVIRGPGATLWGANAVNGVVNIITKSAAETHGGLAVMNLGTEDQPAARLRYGGELADNLSYRVFATSFRRTGSEDSNGGAADDAWSGTHGGFRLDWALSAATLMTLQGDYFSGKFHEVSQAPILAPPYSVVEHEIALDEGGDVLARWTHDFPDASQLTVQFYYDHAIEAIATEHEDRDIYDLDLQQHFALSRRQDLVIGAGYRFVADKITPTPELTIDPIHRGLQVFSCFVQDSVALLRDKVTLTLGSKFEHSDFTGFEFQPSARVLWRASQNQILWGAISRALRTPTRLEHDGRLLTQVDAPATLHVEFGNPDLQSEHLIAYELGYRLIPGKELSFDLSAFWNDYDNLVQYVPAADFIEVDPQPPHTVEPSVARNSVAGYNYGAELASQWQVSSAWRLSGGYSWLVARFPRGFEANGPKDQFFLRAHVKLAPQIELDSAVNYFSRVPGAGVAAYLRWDIGLTWHPFRSLEISLVGQNLLSARHREFNANDTASEVARNFYGKLALRF